MKQLKESETFTKLWDEVQNLRNANRLLRIKLEERIKEITHLEYIVDGWEICDGCEGEGGRSNGCHGNDPAYEEWICNNCDGEGYTKKEESE
jgi:DnaJ-class molecular chaperone